jgi:hypothetical protein
MLIYATGNRSSTDRGRNIYRASGNELKNISSLALSASKNYLLADKYTFVGDAANGFVE